MVINITIRVRRTTFYETKFQEITIFKFITNCLLCLFKLWLLLNLLRHISNSASRDDDRGPRKKLNRINIATIK